MSDNLDPNTQTLGGAAAAALCGGLVRRTRLRPGRRPVVQRSDPEGRKARAADYARVDQIRALDDALLQALLALADERLDQFAAKALEFALVVGLLCLDGFTVLPDVEAFTTLLAELADRDKAI